MVTAHVVIHSVHEKGSSGVVLKLDYEKAYDKVNWDFLLEILQKRVFGGIWLKWMKMILQRGSVGVYINNFEGGAF